MGDKVFLDKFEYDDGDEYEPTDSEAEYSEEDKELLRQVRERRKRAEDSKEQELMAFDESDDDEDDDDDDDVGALMRDSDIENADSNDELPDTTNWGSKSRNYYNTDFVDPDYNTYTAEQEEMAKEEEEEAKKIQVRLAKQMKEEDFLLDDTLLYAVKPIGKKEKVKPEKTTEIKADLAGITKKDKIRLFQEDSPEFKPLVSDFERYITEVDQLISPVMKYVHKNNVPIIPALQFAELYQNIALSYCSNVSFYLLLKAKRAAVRNHPVTKRLLQLKKLIKQLQDKYDNIIRPQLEALLERIVDGDKFEVLDINDISQRTKVRKQNKLGILDKYDDIGKPKEASEDEVDKDIVENTMEGEDSDEDKNDDENVRRGITYQISKNKGLTPARKKEQRNPRVKHRNKFRKALVRRKGAIRTVRTETKRYGGEISGIKATVSKSVKFKV